MQRPYLDDEIRSLGPPSPRSDLLWRSDPYIPYSFGLTATRSGLAIKMDE